ncbi:MAG: FAD-dependent oxidoreductase [Flavipsychrobacter sp.]|nr:FAD-dependent oxidoreductase [Flavipsychrobacter sp.]
MYSYWEQQSFLHYHHIVAGAGIVGLSTAIELKKRYPAESVLVLERGILPVGASTRNAGFACMGSATELLDDLQVMTEPEVVQLFNDRKTGLEILRGRLGNDRIGYKQNGSFELIGTEEIGALDKIQYLNDLLFPITNRLAFTEANDRITSFGFSTAHTKALVQNNCEGELHTGKMMRALAEYAMMLGIEIKTGAEIISFDEDEQAVNVIVRDPYKTGEYILHSTTLSICTNAFTKQLLPGVDVIPGRGQVLVTEAIPGLFKGVFHFDKGYYYFREIDGRILIGGGRNLDFAGETTTSIELNERIQNDLEQKLKDIIIPGRDFKVASRWSGIMAFGANKRPIVKAYSARVFGAFRMGGMGVALGSYAAAKLIEIIDEVR